MEMQNFVDLIVTAKRKQRMIDSPQLTLGQLISEIEKIGIKKENGEDMDIAFDFGSAIPTTLASWRGSYAELALGYRLSGYDAYDQEKGHFSDVTAEKVLAELKQAVGATYYGWKGGDFLMDENTPVWVANQGNADNTIIIGVLNAGYKMVLLTAYHEY